jgi:tRNA (guanine37-N1)-methyltransferase
MDVPPILLSGNHGAVEAWRRREALRRTRARRPDLLTGLALDAVDLASIESFDEA